MVKWPTYRLSTNCRIGIYHLFCRLRCLRIEDSTSKIAAHSPCMRHVCICNHMKNEDSQYEDGNGRSIITSSSFIRGAFKKCAQLDLCSYNPHHSDGNFMSIFWRQWQYLSMEWRPSHSYASVRYALRCLSNVASTFLTATSIRVHFAFVPYPLGSSQRTYIYIWLAGHLCALPPATAAAKTTPARYRYRYNAKCVTQCEVEARPGD